MAEAGSAWLTPKEIADRLSSRKAREVQEDLLYGRRTRREILDLVMEAAGCNEYSAEDFLREFVKLKVSLILDACLRHAGVTPYKITTRQAPEPMSSRHD